MGTFWLSLGSVILAAAAGRVIVIRRRRERALRAVAHEHRLNFSPDDLIGLHARYQNLDMIRRGHSRHVSDVLYGPTADGLVTLFCYHYELGFGARCTTRRWRFAVVETPGACHKHWQAEPAGASTPIDPDVVDRFRLRCDHADTRERLVQAGIEDVFRTAPAAWHWEARGPLVAVAAPYDPDPRTTRHLLTAARDLARRLADAGA